jgi:hypothetical protein
MTLATGSKLGPCEILGQIGRTPRTPLDKVGRAP